MISEDYVIGNYTVEIYHNPSVSLRPHLQEKLMWECLAVAKNGFSEELIDEEAVRQHLLDTSTTIVIRDEYKQAVGVAGSKVIRFDDDLVVYLQGGAISKEHRKRGLYKIIVALRVMEEVKNIDQNSEKKTNIFIGGRTQNPLGYKFMHRKLNAFPYPNGYIDEKIKFLAKKFVKYISNNSESCVFDDNVFVARNSLRISSYGKDSGLNLYGKFIPFCVDDYEINKYMQDNMNWNNGDALIILGHYNKKDVEALLPSSTVTGRRLLDSKVA